MTALLVGSCLSVGVYINSCARGYAEMGLYNRGLLTALSKGPGQGPGQGLGPYQPGPTTAPQVPLPTPPPSLLSLVNVALLDVTHQHHPY